MRPWSSLSLVASTAPPAAPIASKSARSSRGSRGLGELDVVDDLARARGMQASNDPCVERARERPLLAERAEGLVVDRDDDHVIGPLGAAQVEARLERLALWPVERPGQLDGDADQGGHERHAGQRAHPLGQRQA